MAKQSKGRDLRIAFAVHSPPAFTETRSPPCTPGLLLSLPLEPLATSRRGLTSPGQRRLIPTQDPVVVCHGLRVESRKFNRIAAHRNPPGMWEKGRVREYSWVAFGRNFRIKLWLRRLIIKKVVSGSRATGRTACPIRCFLGRSNGDSFLLKQVTPKKSHDAAQPIL